MNGSNTVGAGQVSTSTTWAGVFDRSFVGCQGPVHSVVRTAGPAVLAQALQCTRARTMGLMQAWQNVMPDLSVPPQQGMNPPLWEWGHIAWFQDWWTVRNRQRYLGTRSASAG